MSSEQRELFPAADGANATPPGPIVPEGPVPIVPAPVGATSAPVGATAAPAPAPRPSRAAADHAPLSVGAGVYGPFRLDARASGVYVLTFDDPDRRVNLLDSKSLDSLRAVVAALKAKGGVAPRALLLVSGKENQFIAGADVNEFQRLESPQEAEAKAKDA
ncbi:MAG TPA: hypothetical protein VFU59_10645, partial [Candidatus Eisenbacteria bacterium]|nr:hypothetical protein [Candidatus Eisenbacteria bacterium]